MHAPAGCDWIYKLENKHISCIKSSGRRRNQIKIPKYQAILKRMNLNIKTLLLTQWKPKVHNGQCRLLLENKKKALKQRSKREKKSHPSDAASLKWVSAMRLPVPVWEWSSPTISSQPTSLQACKRSCDTTAPFSSITHWDLTPFLDGL